MSKTTLRRFAAVAMTAGVLLAMAQSAAQAQDEQRTVAPVATSKYICTPSGFGHKARCYLRRD